MPVTQADDKVWFDAHHKLQGICNEVSANLAGGNKIVLLSHFPTTLSTLERLLTERTIPNQKISTYALAQLCFSPPAVWVGLARAFLLPTALQLKSQDASPIRIIVAEHHPMQSRDQSVLDEAQKIGCPSELCFYLSLDDPLLVHFNGNTIQKLFKQLGIDETEYISHHLVSAAIRGAQEKIESLVPRDLQAESIEDWFKYNI